MARLLRIEFPGALYHVTLRGVDRQRIFRDKIDYKRFLANVEKYAPEFHVRVFLYCLMPNHVHLVLETAEANLGRFMGRLQTAYCVYFNLRHHRSGHVMQGRYGAKLVEGDQYLLALSRYVHLNPVRTAGMQDASLEERAKAMQDFVWSSYRTYLGRDPCEWVETGPLLAMTGSRKLSTQRRHYREYVEAGLEREDTEFERCRHRSPLAIGGEGFIENAAELYEKLAENRERREDVSMVRVRHPLEAEKVIEVVAEESGLDARQLVGRRRGYERALLGLMLCRHAAMTQREVAGHLGIRTGAAVSMQQKRLEVVMHKEERLREMASRIEGRLQKLNS